MTGIAFCRILSGVLECEKPGEWVLGSSDRRGQDKSRKVRPVGGVRQTGSNSGSPQTLRKSHATCDSWQRAVVTQLSTPCDGHNE